MGARCWRPSFYGSLKVDKALSCTRGFMYGSMLVRTGVGSWIKAQWCMYAEARGFNSSCISMCKL